MTLYMRFKKEMENDENGLPIHLDFLLDKFKGEFDSQLMQSEVRRKNNI